MVTLSCPSQPFWMPSAKGKYLQNLTWSVVTGKFPSASPINIKLHFVHTWDCMLFSGLPLGLKTAPNTFQQILNTVFADYLHKWLVVYVDDIIQWAMTDEEALAQYSLLFQRLVKAGMQLKPSKCTYFLRKGNQNTGTSYHSRRSINTNKQRSRSNPVYAHTNEHFCSQAFSGTLQLF